MRLYDAISLVYNATSLVFLIAVHVMTEMGLIARWLGNLTSLAFLLLFYPAGVIYLAIKNNRS